MPHSTSAGNGDAMRILPQQQPDSIKRVAHRLPCTIHADGDLPTARAFCPMPDPLQSFRGRLLTNATFTIPADSQRTSLVFFIFILLPSQTTTTPLLVKT